MPTSSNADETLLPSDAPVPAPIRLVATTAHCPPTGPKSSRYQSRFCHARGGMGEIWLTEDISIGREVALKVLRRESTAARLRFVAEAQITGQLEHPSIVPVHDFGMDDDGNPFYVMKFLRGKTLKETIGVYHAHRQEDPAQAQVELTRLLNIFVDLCQAVAYAHSRGVLHRDLKPDNIMLGSYGETIVVDWGIAKVVGQRDAGHGASGAMSGSYGSGSVRMPVTGNTSATVDGTLLGTPSYMAPEMADGRATETDERTDVYLLGATLYEILTGRAPREGNSRDELIELARSATPQPVNKLWRACPKPLNAIVQKSMNARREGRYATATDLLDDMQRYLAGEAVSVCPESIATRAWRWCRRHQLGIKRWITGSVICGLGLTAILATQKVVRFRQLQQAQSDFEQFTRLADEARFYAASSDAISEEIPYFDLARGEELTSQAVAIADHWGPRLERWPITDRASELKSKLYELLVENAQIRLARREQPADVLRSLDRAATLDATPTPAYRQLRLAVDPTHAGPAVTASSDPHENARELFFEAEQARLSTSHASMSTQREAIQHALILFKQAIHYEPQHYWAHFQIGRCELSLGQIHEAIESWTTCIALQPKAAWAYSTRGLALAMARDFPAAESDLDTALELQPGFLPAHLNRGVCYQYEGKIESAISEFTLAASPSSGSGLVEGYYYLARIHLAREEYASAANELRAVLMRRPDLNPARLSLAEANLALGDLVDEKTQLDAVVASSDIRPETDAARAAARGHLLRNLMTDLTASRAKPVAAAARNELEFALQQGVTTALVLADLAAVTEKLNGYSDSISFYDRALAVSDDPAIRLRRGCALLMLHRIDGARSDFAQAVKLTPTDPVTHFWLGYSEAVDHSEPAAVREAVQTAIGGADDYVCLHNLACLFARLARADESSRSTYVDLTISALRRAVDLWHLHPTGVNELDAIRSESDFAYAPIQESAAFRTLISP